MGPGMTNPSHWLSIETIKKIGRLLGNTLDELLGEAEGKEGRHIKILVEIDLSNHS